MITYSHTPNCNWDQGFAFNTKKSFCQYVAASERSMDDDCMLCHTQYQHFVCSVLGDFPGKNQRDLLPCHFVYLLVRQNRVFLRLVVCRMIFFSFRKKMSFFCGAIPLNQEAGADFLFFSGR
jgi:hypothetical protein